MYHNATTEDRTTATGDLHRKFAEYRVEWFQTYACGQTDRQTHREINLSQYSAPLAGQSNNPQSHELQKNIIILQMLIPLYGHTTGHKIYKTLSLLGPDEYLLYAWKTTSSQFGDHTISKTKN